jgi:phosphoribosylamine-glycine ligase
LCRTHGIPTATYERFRAAAPAKAYVRGGRAPVVVKADGLAAGKGVVVAANVAEAEAAIDMMFGGALGEAGGEIVVEEFLDGEEASFFAMRGGPPSRLPRRRITAPATVILVRTPAAWAPSRRRSSTRRHPPV